MTRLSTSEVTIFPNAAPMTTPTARSTTLPRAANSLNSLRMLIRILRPENSNAAARRQHGQSSANYAGWVRSSARSDDRAAQCGDIAQACMELIAANQGGNARRRAGENNVAGCQLEQLGQFVNDLRHRKEHVADIGVLA